MSERKRQIICTTIAFLAWAATMYTLGEQRMKRWQDSYYQSHPVVKEVHETWYPVSTIPACKVGEYLSYTTSEWKCLPAPPKKAKPAKADCNSFGCKYPNLSRPAKAISAHEALSPIFNMLDVETTKHLTKFYVTIPYVEGHWEIMATDRVNALLRLGSTSWTESEWKSCSSCQESKTVESIAVERWKNAPPANCNVIGFYHTSCDYRAQPSGDIDQQGAVCVAGSSDGHPIEIPCPQITRPQNCAIYDGQPFPCTIPVQLDSLPAAKP